MQSSSRPLRVIYWWTLTLGKRRAHPHHCSLWSIGDGWDEEWACRMFMPLRVKDWNNNIREIHCLTCTHSTLYCVSVGAAEHPSTRLGPVLAGSKRQAWEAEGRADLPAWQGTWKCQMEISVNTLSSCAPGSQKGGWAESKAEQPRQSWQSSAVGAGIHTSQCVLTAPIGTSCPTKPTQRPHRDQQLHSKVQGGRQGAKCKEKPKVQAPSSMAQKKLWYRVTDSVGVSTVCYSFSKMLPKTEEQKKVSEEQRFALELFKCGGLFPLYFRIHKYTRSPINVFS